MGTTIRVTFDSGTKKISVDKDTVTVGNHAIEDFTWNLTGAKFDSSAGLQWKGASAGTFKRVSDTRWTLHDDNSTPHGHKQHFPYSITVVTDEGATVTLDPEVVNDPTTGPVPPPRPRPRPGSAASKSPAGKKKASKSPPRKTRRAPAPGRKKTR